MPPEVFDAINAQIGMELASARLYLSMAAHFHAEHLPGFAHWMRLQADEENEHAMRLFDHLFERQQRPVLGALEAPPAQFGSVREVVQAVVDHEAKVTASIHTLLELAESHKDHATASMLDWFVTEQVEEEKQAGDVLGRLDLIESTGGSLIMLDKEMGKRGRD